MKKLFFHARPGVTLVELVLFMGLLGMMAATVLPFLFSATESRQRQDAIALVEQNGAQILQTLTQQIRHAERILDPPVGGTGTVLALQVDNDEDNPTIIALQSGSIVLVKGLDRFLINSDLVGVTSFLVDNTSASEDRQSVALSFNLRRTIRLHKPLTYEAFFEAVVNLFPDDVVTGDSCGCDLPFCDAGSGMYIWQRCENDVCVPYTDFSCVIED